MKNRNWISCGVIAGVLTFTYTNNENNRCAPRQVYCMDNTFFVQPEPEHPHNSNEGNPREPFTSYSVPSASGNNNNNSTAPYRKN
jgi:hypothetical protein